MMLVKRQPFCDSLIVFNGRKCCWFFIIRHQNKINFLWNTHNGCAVPQPSRVGYGCLNSLHAKFFRRNINMYLHFMSFLHTDMPEIIEILPRIRPGGRFKNTYELLNLRALKFSYVNIIHIFQYMGKIFWVEFQRYPLKFHIRYLTHTLKDMIFMQFWNFKSS